MTDDVNLFGSGEFGGALGGGLSTNVQQLITDALMTTGIGSQDTRYRATALAFANQVYLTILKGRHWKFMNKELFVETKAPFTSGSVNVTAGSHLVEAYNGQLLFNTNILGGLFQVTGFEDYYRAFKTEKPTEFEITPGYARDTATDQSYQILFDRIKLDSKIQDLKSMTITSDREIKPLGLQQFRTMKSNRPGLIGTPEWYTIVEQNPQDGSMVVEMYPSPDRLYSVHMEYTERPLRLEDSETCFMVIPSEHYDVILLALRAKIYQDQNNMQAYKDTTSEAASAWLRMVGDQELTDSRARFIHGRNYFHRYRNRRYPGYYGLKWFGKVDD